MKSLWLPPVFYSHDHDVTTVMSGDTTPLAIFAHSVVSGLLSPCGSGALYRITRRNS